MHMSWPIRTAIVSFGHLLARSDASVVALGDDVGQAVVDDLDLDVGY